MSSALSTLLFWLAALATIAVLALLTGCLPFYEADATTWKVGITGTHKEVGDALLGVVDPDRDTLAAP